MKYILSLVFVWSVFSAVSVLANEEKPGETDCSRDAVDMADDINFADSIVDCSPEATVLYDPESRKTFFQRSGLPEKVYEKRAESLEARANTSDSASQLEESVHMPGAAFIIRARYSITAPYQALSQLHQDMATYCPLGWEKDREWTSPVENDYYLHYEFTCASPE